MLDFDVLIVDHIKEFIRSIGRVSALHPERSIIGKDKIMLKTFLTTAIATVAVASAAIVVPSQAEARGWGPGLGIAAGVVGGVIVGSAIANQNRYNDGPYYGNGPVVYEDGYVHCHRVAFVDNWGYEHVRRVCR